MFSSKLSRFVAAGAAAIAVAAGGIAIGNSGSSNGTSGTANAAQPAAQTQAGAGKAPGAGQGPRSGQAPRGGQPGGSGDQLTAVSGKVPANWSPGTGTIVTGADADKAKAAAVASGNPGTVNRVLKLSDGSYVVHFFATSGPHHVFVSKDFKVTAAQ
jgi:hypothetical protein